MQKKEETKSANPKSQNISENISENESLENTKRTINNQIPLNPSTLVQSENDDPQTNTVNIQVHFIGRNVPERLPEKSEKQKVSDKKSRKSKKDTPNPTVVDSEGPKQLDGDIYSDNSSLRDEDQENPAVIKPSEFEESKEFPRDSFASSARGSIPEDPSLLK